MGYNAFKQFQSIWGLSIMNAKNQEIQLILSISLTALTLVLVLRCLFVDTCVALANEPFKLGVEEKNYLQDGGLSYPAYPAPQTIPARPGLSGRALQSNILPNNRHAEARAPLPASVQTSVALPPAFLGVWMVQGQRLKVEALPEFQESAEQAFTLNNSQFWTISGSPATGYSLGSNTGIETPLIVDKVQGMEAFIRYQHPIGHTVAQEAIVMQMVAGGAQFNGLERVSIVKQGLPGPRAKVTYQLVGRRQR